MSFKRIITLGRQCGSGGHSIGILVAERLGVPLYDKKLLKIVAERSGMTEETVVERDLESSIPLSILASLSSGYNTNSKVGFSLPTLSVSDEIYATEAQLIHELAERDPCVIVGRCSDYLLRDRDDCLHVFIHAKLEERIKRVISEHRVAPQEAETHVRYRDKKRGRHYRYITDRTWGAVDNYHLCLDSGEFGIDRCVDMIVQAAQIP